MLFETYVNTMALMNCYICLHGPNPGSCQPNCEITPPVEPKRVHSRVGCPPMVLEPNQTVDNISNEQLKEYQRKANTTLKNFKGLWKEPGWAVQEGDDLGDVNIIESDNYGTVWSLSMEVDIKPCDLIVDVFGILQNPTIKTSELYRKFTDTLGVTYMTTPKYPMLEPRDFADLSGISEEDGVYFCTYESITGVKGKVDGLVRALNRPSGIVMEPVYYDNSVKTHLTWIINNDYKLPYGMGWLAQKMFPQNLRKIMQHIQQYVRDNHN